MVLAPSEAMYGMRAMALSRVPVSRNPEGSSVVSRVPSALWSKAVASLTKRL